MVRTSWYFDNRWDGLGEGFCNLAIFFKNIQTNEKNCYLNKFSNFYITTQICKKKIYIYILIPNGT